MVSLPSRERATAAVLFLLAVLALNLPVVGVANRATPVLGVAPLFLWFVGWGVVVCLALVWAAYHDAFSLTDADVPPEIWIETESGTHDDSGDD
ncbi:hypothetical protein VB773_22150 [Haloarculaceae archaeon H-GB2-1]|nr:hypothetical protein [Haloarculaceae archaeon H-GB1-1]MEA5389541.1 hypothetical protein [Haloarculaceae archaeon H-GB11]MEA5410004.1 hypothetical protein [Haloarculaceae archaeon H-GB2-1]